MATLPILKYPDPRLTRRCEPVESFDAELDVLVADMIETMHVASGIGLAAVQVGRTEQVTVIDLSSGTDPEAVVVLVNPGIIEEEGEVAEEEGCLSFPDLILVVPRPERVVVEAQDLRGEPFRIDAVQLMARCLHHEIDHLQGVLFLERVSPLKQDLAQRKIAKRIRANDW